MKRLFIVLMLWGVFLGGMSLPTLAQGNPFLRNNNSTTESVNESTVNEPVETGWWVRLKGQFRTQQAIFQNEMAEKTRDLTEASEGHSRLWIILIGTSFLYGAFHSLGPGHGKCVVCSYFTAEASSLKRGLVLGYLVAIVHALSAFLVVSVVYYLLKGSSQMVFNEATRYIGLVGYGLITMLGLSLLMKNIYRRRTTAVCASDCDHDHHHHRHDHDHHYGHDHHHHEHKPQSLWLAALAIGVVPCPGALTLLLFSISLNTLWLGVILASAIALGMGLTISLLAVLTVLSRRQAFKWLSNRFSTETKSQSLERWFNIGGAAATFLIGSFLFVLHL